MSIFKKFSFILFIFLFATKILSQDFVLDQITVSANKINTPISQTGTNISIINKTSPINIKKKITSPSILI